MSVILMMMTIGLDMQANAWRSINDGVMGGLSSGGMVQIEEGLRFTGELSLENNGGFSSARRLVEQDLSGAKGVRLEVRGDGREYQFRIRQNSRFDGIAWRAMFSASNEWQIVEIMLDDFVPVFRGRLVPEAGPVVASEIQQVGFLISDKSDGRFELDIRRIEFTGTKPGSTHEQ
jgi:monofunctional biosynthetic peptidoglycan transglycosylase